MVPIRNDGKASRCTIPITLVTDFIYIEISKRLRNVSYVSIIMNKRCLINNKYRLHQPLSQSKNYPFMRYLHHSNQNFIHLIIFRPLF